MGRRGGKRRGLRWEPRDGWPLDGLLVGVATLRTTREMFRWAGESRNPPRAWDLALRTGVTPQGSANSLERLRRLGLAERLPPTALGRAHPYRLEWSHPLAPALDRLFDTERAMCPRPRSMAWRRDL